MTNKLLYIHAAPIDGLAANSVQVLSMCQSFAKLGLDVTLAVPVGASELSEEELKRAIEKKMGAYPLFSVTTFRQRLIFGRGKLFSCYLPARRLIAKLKPDLIFLRNVVLVHAAIASNVPFIYESHNSLMHDSSSLLNILWTKYIVRVSNNALMKKFIAISGALGDFWINQGIAEHRVLSVHDGFDQAMFNEQLSVEEARTVLKMPLSDKTVLYVGSLYRDRGIEDIIFLASKLPEIKFRIVGGPDAEKARYIKLASAGNVENIEFLGSIEHSEVPTYLFSSDILLMTWSSAVKTIEYCSPLKLFEYMAAGRIIVGHGFRTIREVLVDGEDSYLADPESRDELLKQLTRAIADDSPLFGDRARAKAFDEYSWDRRASLIMASIA